MIFKTFKARIHGVVLISEGNQAAIDGMIAFSKTRILLKPEQINRMFYSPLLVDPVVHRAEYDFDKLLNNDDQKQFSIVLKNRLNALDKGIHHLDISTWNKVRANFVHHRYWLDREKEWIVKTLISTLIGFVFGLMGAYLGYKLGFQSGNKAIKAPSQVIEKPAKK